MELIIKGDSNGDSNKKSMDPENLLSADKAPEPVYTDLGSAVLVGRKEGEPPRYDKLPARIYTVDLNMKLGFYLTPQASFDLPPKVYGKTSEHAARILKGYQNQTGNMGVLLEGLKGSGKTMLSRVVCMSAIRAFDMPVLLVSQDFASSDFFNFLQMIDQECVVMFDEFEKVFPPESQERMLSLLDGVFRSRKLFLLTCNDTYRVNEHMKNRPGRIRYRLTFKGLDRDFITEYVKDKLIHPARVEQVITVATMFGDSMNFDMLQALVQEVNEFNEEPAKSLEYLNARPTEVNFSRRYTVRVINKALEEITTFDQLPRHPEWNGNPMNFDGDDDRADRQGIELGGNPEHNHSSPRAVINAQDSFKYGVLSKEVYDGRVKALRKYMSKLKLSDDLFPDLTLETYNRVNQIGREAVKATEEAVAALTAKGVKMSDAVGTERFTRAELNAALEQFTHRVTCAQTDLVGGTGSEGVFRFKIKDSELMLELREKPVGFMSDLELVRRSYGGHLSDYAV